MNDDRERLGPLLHGTARAWRLKLDARLKPMGLSQAKWRTLMHLSIAPRALTQAEIAARLGIEEPTLVTLLHRLERAGWVTRQSSPHDRRCKIVRLARRAHRVIARITATAHKLRRELLADVPASELRICMSVLERIQRKAEKGNGGAGERSLAAPMRSRRNGHGRNGHAIVRMRRARPGARR